MPELIVYETPLMPSLKRSRGSSEYSNIPPPPPKRRNNGDMEYTATTTTISEDILIPLLNDFKLTRSKRHYNLKMKLSAATEEEQEGQEEEGKESKTLKLKMIHQSGIVQFRGQRKRRQGPLIEFARCA